MKNSNRQSCSCLRSVGGSFLLTCNFDVCYLPILFPVSTRNAVSPGLLWWSGITIMPIWNNKFTCIQNKSVYYPQLIKMGILKIENMLTGFNELKQKETTLTMANCFLRLGIVHSLPCEWWRMIKAGNISLFSQPTLPRNFHSDQIHVKPNENSVVEIQALTSKQIYKKTCNCDQEHITTNRQGQVYSYIFRKQFGLGKYLWNSVQLDTWYENKSVSTQNTSQNSFYQFSSF